MQNWPWSLAPINSASGPQNLVVIYQSPNEQRTSHAYDEALAKRIYRHVVQDYATLLGGMADKIQSLTWD